MDGLWEDEIEEEDIGKLFGGEGDFIEEEEEDIQE